MDILRDWPGITLMIVLPLILQAPHLCFTHLETNSVQKIPTALPTHLTLRLGYEHNYFNSILMLIDFSALR